MKTVVETKDASIELFENGPTSRRSSTTPDKRSAKSRLRGWRIDEVNTLLASARAMPGLVGAVPAGAWWSALLLCILDTGISTERLLAMPRLAYDPKQGVLTIGHIGYPLHALTIDALTKLAQWSTERLLAWPYDNGRPPFHMLYRYMKELLFRVGLPHVTSNLTTRLRITRRETPNLLDLVDLTAIVRPRIHKPQFPRKRRPAPKVPRPRKKLRAVPAKESLQRFFTEMYVPLKLTGRSPKTVKGYQQALNRVADWCGHEPSLSLLTDDSLDKLLSWAINERKMSPATANSLRAHVLALWRYAWRKRRVKELPRDVTKVREDRPNPECWTAEEVGRIIGTTKNLTGTVHGVPKREWFTAFVLTLYYTGLRVTALRSVARSAYDPRTGWLAVPAGVQKHRAGQVYQLPVDAREAIARVLETSPWCDQLFPTLYKRDLYRDYRWLLQVAGLPSGRKDSFHRLRKTCATHICDKLGLEAAKDYLGHSHPSVTLRYIDRRKLNQVQPTNVLPPPAFEEASLLLPSPASADEGAA